MSIRSSGRSGLMAVAFSVLSACSPGGLGGLDADRGALAAGTCRKTGCSGELCSDTDVASTCLYREEYACFASATCVRQPSGSCGFTPTPELTACLAGPVDAGPAPCFRGGCSGQLCTDTPGLASTCEYRAEYACFASARCERQSNGTCGFTPTPALTACLAGPFDAGAP
jgi:hypothetical protein